MKLSDVFAAENILHSIQASEKGEALRELVDRLAETGSIDGVKAKDVAAALMRREDLGSTGIGKGMAVPHAKISGLEGIVGAFGRSEAGVEFNALDGKPVELIFLIVSSPEEVEAHLAMLKKVTALLKDDDICMFMRRAKNREELAELLTEAEERLAVRG